MTFSDWLLSRGIDVEKLEPDMEAALLGQYEAESDPDSILVLTDDELWAHAIREPAV